TELSEQENINSSTISNPLQHKGRGCPANKRYLSAIENHDTKSAVSINQEEISASESVKKNKRQYAMCKSWYHDSRNCPLKK
ncbi:706_t:CDS:1, partial [Racocetra persica]